MSNRLVLVFIPARHPLRFKLKENGKKVAALRRYIIVGFHHIVPEGVDHILFVLGLFLFSTRLGPLLWQISAFTVAHSIPLGLALYGVVRLPSAITEPLIAASIVFVAVENIFVKDLKPWRYAVVFCFGLIHGLRLCQRICGSCRPSTPKLSHRIGRF